MNLASAPPHNCYPPRGAATRRCTSAPTIIARLETHMTAFDSNRLAHGMEVYDTNDDKIGSVDDIYDTSTRTGDVARGTTSRASGGGYVRVPTGFLGLGREHHIPFSAISRVEDDKIYLRVPKEQLDDLGYAEAPTRYASPEDAALLE